MILSDVSIRRPVFTTMVVLGLMTLGLLATRNIGVDLFPDVSFPMATVTTVYPGAGPEEVEQLVTKQIEEVVSSVNGVDEVRSYSRDSVSMVIIQFKLEIDPKAAASDTRDKIAGIRNKLPDDIEDPIVQRVDITAVPILTYVVSSSRGPAATRQLVDDVIKPKFEAVDGVASVTVTGGLEREVHVYVDRTRIESMGLSLAGLAQQLKTEGFDLPGGRLTTGKNELNVKTIGRFRTIEELRQMVVASLPNGAQVHLGEVARIEDGFKEIRTQAYLDGQPAVTLELQKQGGSNTVAIADRTYKMVEQLQGELPPDVKFTKAVDGSVFIRENIHEVTVAIFFGGAMAILVIFLFMLDWRSTLISSLSLPTSVLTTFLAMWWMGFTFNMMSLLAISLAIGLLIDDAVVVRENIYRHMEMGEGPIEAAQKGTSEIGLAVMATTFTIVAVFVPVAFMGGVVGRFFKQFGLTVAAAVLVSLFISFTLDPMMSARVMKPIEPGEHERMKHHRVFGPILRFYDRLDDVYRRLLGWALDNRWKVVAAAAVLFFGSFGLTPLMGKEFITPEDRGEFRLLLEMPAGTSLAEMERISQEAEKRVRENPNVKTIFTIVGPSEEANKSSLRVYTKKRAERPGLSQWQIQEDLRQRLSVMPSLKYTVADMQIVEGPAAELPITLYVRGDDYAKLQGVAQAALEAVRSTKGTKDADMSYRAGKPETNIRVDRSRAADLGVSIGALAQTVRLAFEGQVVAKYRDGDRDHDIRMQLSPEDRSQLKTLDELTVPATGRRMGATGPGGGTVRLTDVAQVTDDTGPATIERMNRQRQIIITANLANRSLGDAVSDIEAKLATIEKPPGFSFSFGSQTKRMQETFSNMLLALGVAVFFIYFVLASQFESFIHPFTIMLSLPLALVGALLMLFLSDLPIGMPAMIGIVLLMGLVTKNAILLVDYTNEARTRGLSVREAILEAGPTRLRPILMTSAAMVLGMVPTAFGGGEGSEFRAPMAMAVIGGVITSTFLTLLVVPVVYTWLDRFSRRAGAEVVPLHQEVANPPPGAAAMRMEAHRK